MIPPWVLIDVHLKHIKMFIADLFQESLERSQRTPGLTLFEQMMANGIISSHVFRVTRSSAHGTDDKPSSRPEQSSDFRKAKMPGIVNQAMHTAAINNELKRRILTLMNMADIPDKKLSREPRLLKTIFCPADRGCGQSTPHTE
jgi:hypothetical protein